ncbi:hypothetical protein [Methylobacterium oryzisoli]|uniref:hypothetical protein n=1 Tax=Methylobacterium oryzisoli TaxID=3385502 RepID=UPI0038924926
MSEYSPVLERDLALAQQRSVGSASALDGVDTALAAACALVAMLISAWGFATLGPALDTEHSFNIWFQADTPRVVLNLTDLASNHYRTAVHPISSLLTTPLVLALAKAGVPPLLACKALIALAGGACAALLFITGRLLRLGRLDAALVVALFLTSAAYLHWYGQIELSAFSGVTIVLSLLLLVRESLAAPVWWVLMSAATLSITVTNWVAGLAATFARWPLRGFAAISAGAFVLVCLLAIAQQHAMTNAQLFFKYSSARNETQWTQMAMERHGRGTWSPARSLYSLFVTTAVAPMPQRESKQGVTVVTNQRPTLADMTWLSLTAIAAWIGLLACGAYAGWHVRHLRRVGIGIGLMLLAQALLHSIYGDVTFLYAAHVIPMLVGLAALAFASPARHFARVAALVVVVAGGLNNVGQFRAAAAFANDILRSGGNAVDPVFNGGVLRSGLSG